MGYVEFAEFTGLLVGLSIPAAAVLTYVYDKEAARATAYVMRHPAEYRRLSKFRKNPQSINPDDFPNAMKWGYIEEYPSKSIDKCPTIRILI